eukprot:gene17328-8906_t
MDPRWIGAWWLGFFVFAWFAIISGVFLLCFPREMPKYRKKRLEAMDAGKLRPANKEIGKGLKGLLRSLIDLLKNKTYVFSCLGLTVKIIFAAALGGFYTKIIVLKFGGSLSQVSLLSAAVFIPANTIGVAFGSFLMKKLSIANSPKRASQYLIVTGVFLTIFSSVWLLPGCKSTNIVGAAIPYQKSNEIGRITSQCNSGCGCSRRSYEPMCGKDGYTYFSPCFAGCQSKVKGGASNCTCVSNGMSSNQTTPTLRNSTYTATSGSDASVTAGRCDRNCKNLVLFLTLCALNLMVSFSGSIPQKMLTLRCVADNQRAFGLGMQIINEIGRITSQCNSGCGCSRRSYEPMCGKDGYTYFSPCFAGCQSKVKGGASNCTCVSEGMSSNQTTPTLRNSTYTATSGSDASVTAGRCDRNCKNLVLFLTLCALNLMVSFSGSIPQKMLTLRCVADNQRAFGLGMQIMFLRLLSFVPGPLILGSIIDSSCLLWGKDDCGNQGNCLEYDVDKLSKHFFTFSIIAAISATIMYFLAWYFYIPQQIVLDERQQNNNENADLIEDTKEKA